MSDFSQYMRSYLADRISKNKKSTAEEYTAHDTKKARASYESTVKNILRNYASALPTHGASAETLGRNGLSGGGFAKYLSNKAKTQKANDINSAKYSLAQAMDESNAMYGKYGNEYEKDRKKRTVDVISKIISSKTTDENGAYSLAVAYGLDEDDSRAVSELATAINRMKAGTDKEEYSHEQKQRAMSRLTELVLSYEYGYPFAKAMGLTEEDANEVALAVEAALKNKGSAAGYYYY